MAAITHVYSIAYVAQLLGEDLDLLEAIVENDDNLTHGSIVSVYTGREESITALTDDGIEELKDMLAAARRSAEHWQQFLDAFVSDPDVIARVKAQSPR
jgi:DNA-binding PadR family transcriptional regulator